MEELSEEQQTFNKERGAMYSMLKQAMLSNKPDLIRQLQENVDKFEEIGRKKGFIVE